MPADKLWHRMAPTKHYGVETSMLERRYAPSVARHFATAHPADFDHNGLIWMADVVKTNQLLPKKQRSALEEAGVNAMSADLIGVWHRRTSPSVSAFHRRPVSRDG